jgi:hypothetical protein
MPPSKLTETDKHSILDFYQHTEETTSTLAVRYGVSNNTIIRVLKSTLTEEVYERLVQQKRAAARSSDGHAIDTAKKESQVSLDFPPEPELEPIAQPTQPETPQPAPVISSRRPRKPLQQVADAVVPLNDQLPLLPNITLETPTSQVLSSTTPVSKVAKPVLAKDRVEPLQELEVELLTEFKHDHVPLEEPDDLDDDLEAEDDLDSELEDDLDDDLDDDSETNLSDFAIPGFNGDVLENRSLAEDTLPRICYLVIDRTADLVTRPLRDFGELGQINQEQKDSRILPISDNARVARRFSNRNQRIIKVPDGKMLYRVAEQLQAKGITRLLFDGHLYSFN